MARSIHNLTGFHYTDFTTDFEALDQWHTERVRREPNTTYFDEFAKQELKDLYPNLFNQIVEGWSRSYYTRDKHLEAIQKYGYPNKPISIFNRSHWDESMNVIQNELSSLPRVRALSVIDQLDQVYYIQSSSAGYGYIGAKGPINGTNHDRAIRRAKATLYSATAADGQGIKHAIQTSVPDVGYTRTQLADLTDKTKVRGVWGRAFHYILLEGTAARPLLETFMDNLSFIQIGSDPITNVPLLLTETKSQCDWLTSLDWSSFDATVNRCEINAAFNLLKSMLIFPDFDTEQAFELSRQLFIHKKIAAPDGKIYWSHKGIPSGSYYTSLVGSIINRLRIEYLFRVMTGFGPKLCFTLGDDSLIGTEGYLDPNRIAHEAYPYGWLVNAEKTETSRNPASITFLGRTSVGLMNQRELKRCIRLLILPEYPVESGAISAFRAKQIADDAGGTSQVLNSVARRLERLYSLPTLEEVPRQFHQYYP